MKRISLKRLTALFLSFTLFMTLSTSCTKKDPDPKSASPQPSSPSVDVEAILSQMSVEEKIGQMFMVSLDGTALNEETAEYLAARHIGNVILFGKNMAGREQISALNTQIQQTIRQATGIPPLIGIDQEGGTVTRITDGATIFPGNMAVAATGDPKNAYLLGEAMGAELYALGINVNFAPVLDVNSNPDNPVIGVRSYSDDPALVGRFGCQMAAGLRSQSVLACGKHFPGHGDTSTDSHLDLPVLNRSEASLRNTELVSFQKAIDQGIDMIMTTHIIFPAFESEQLPATMSEAILTGLLREQMGFHGLIITDGMRMKAITEHFGTAEASLAAAQAGADLILTGDGGADPILTGDGGADPILTSDGIADPLSPTASADSDLEPIDRSTQPIDRSAQPIDQTAQTTDPQSQTIDRLIAAAKDGSLPMKRIDDSVRRILTAKAELGLFDQDLPAPRLSEIDWSAHALLAQQLADQSITLIRDRSELLPSVSAPSGTEPLPAAVDMNLTYANTLFLSPVFSSGPSMAETAREKFGALSFTFSKNPTTEEIRQAGALSRSADQVVLVITDAKKKKGQAALVNRVLALNPSVILISMGSPYDLDLFPDAGTQLCSYEYSATAIDAVLRVLSGELIPEGTCPVTLVSPSQTRS